MFNYTDLPDKMSYADVRRCFIEFLFDNQQITVEQKQYAFEQLLEIAERAYETYELLDEAVMNKISYFILCNIDYEDFDIMDLILSVIPRLGLKCVWEIIVSKKHLIENKPIIKLIEECDAEYGKTVGDPYWDLRKQNL